MMGAWRLAHSVMPKRTSRSALENSVSPVPAPTSSAEGASPASLRAAIVEQVRADPIMWNEGTLGKPVDEYCAWISDSRRWGGQVELAIFAEKYAVEISVTDVQTGRADVYGSGAGHARRVYMM